MYYIMRYMTLDDVTQVVEIDQLSFNSPWSRRSYEFEICDNSNSHMLVLTAPPASPENHNNGAHARLRVVGYGGMWMIDGEAHISTIAVHPEFRGRNLGEVLLSGMLARAMGFQAEYSVLEVRVSNEPAINLYRKYEYEIVGRRRNYYRDNNEDAFLMHLAPFDSGYRRRFDDRTSDLNKIIKFLNLVSRPEDYMPTARE